jgi:hypothetical protein
MSQQNTVFIAYRRDPTGVQLARVVYQLLTHCDVFWELGAPDDISQRQIAARTNTVLIVSEGALAGCSNPDDPLLADVREALRHRHKITPVVAEGVSFEQELASLPDDVRPGFHPRYQIPFSSHALTAFAKRLAPYIKRLLTSPLIPTPASDRDEVARRMAAAEADIQANPPLTLTKDPSIRPLEATNPADWLRLMGWLFIRPSALDAYEYTHGWFHVQKAGSWLTSTLWWLPFWIILVGAVFWPPSVGQNTLVYHAPALWLGVTVGLWFLIGSGKERAWLASIPASAVILLPSFLMGSIFEYLIYPFFAPMVVLSVALAVSLRVASRLTVGVTFMSALGVIIGAFIGLISLFVIPIAVIVMLLVYGLLKSQRRFLTIPLLLIFIAAHGLLIWTYWLGGAQVAR